MSFGDSDLPMDEPAESRERHVPEGVKVTAKLKRGTGTRDQDTIKIEARGETAEEAAEEFEEIMAGMYGGAWASKLRSLQPDENKEGSDE